MLQFILRRLGLVIPTFIGITLLTFAFVHMIPGDPVLIMAGETLVSCRVGDTVFIDDTMTLNGFMLIDTFFWGEAGDFNDAAMHMILPASCSALFRWR